MTLLLTLKEGHDLPEGPVGDVSLPLVQNYAVLRVQLHRLGVCVDDNHLAEGPVEVSEVLEGMQKREVKKCKVQVCLG